MGSKRPKSAVLGGFPPAPGLDRQLVTALVATSLQDGAASTRPHTGSKTVLLGAAAGVGLESTLHWEPRFRSDTALRTPRADGRATTWGKSTAPTWFHWRDNSKGCNVTLPASRTRLETGLRACWKPNLRFVEERRAGRTDHIPRVAKPRTK